jgi:hypothetical protein
LEDRYLPGLTALLVTKAFFGNSFGLHLAMYLLFFYGVAMIQSYCSKVAAQKWNKVFMLRKIRDVNEETRESVEKEISDQQDLLSELSRKVSEFAQLTGSGEGSRTDTNPDEASGEINQAKTFSFFRWLFGRKKHSTLFCDVDGTPDKPLQKLTSHITFSDQPDSERLEKARLEIEAYLETAELWKQNDATDQKIFLARLVALEQEAEKFDRLTASHLAGIRDQLSVLGLLGTVIGLSSAIYSSAASGGDGAVFKGISPEVSAQLGTAFFTTLVALSLRMSLFFYLSRRSLEDQYAGHLLAHLSVSGGSH